MANLKEVRIRIASVTSTQQITKAMKLVSATKLRRAQNAITLMRPYAAKLNGILSNLSDSIDVDSLKVYFDARPIKNVLIVVITSDRGLCGSFNANVIKMANKTIADKYSTQKANGGISVMGIGKKGHEYFSKQPVNYIDNFKESLLTANAETGFAIGEYILSNFKAGKFDAVEIVYNQFKNAATQIIQSEQFLPLAPIVGEKTATADYIYEPSQEEIVLTLIPKSLKTQLYKAIRDSFASEHGARMTAMHKATDNATDLRNQLKLTYNKARQAAITGEILEIVGGAEALNG